MRISPRAVKVLSRLLVAAALGFMAWQIVKNAAALRDFDWEVEPLRLAASVVALSGVYLWGVLVWRLTLGGFGARTPVRPLARAWFVANLGRYIPGVVWQFLSLAQLSTAAGLGPALAVTSLLVQMGFLFLSALVLGAFWIPVSAAGFIAPALPLVRWASPAAVLLVHPRVIRWALALVGRVTRRETLAWHAGWATGVGLLALAAANWLLYGAAFYLFLSAFVPVSPSAIPALAAMNALAWVVGYIVFFAPGGLGYKELALAALLTSMVPAPVAAALSVAARLWTIAGELLPALLLARARPSGEESS